MRKLILLGFLGLVLLFSGCDNQTTNGCSDSGLKLVDYNVYPLEKIYQGDIVAFAFWLENKGSSTAGNVKVDFFDTPGFDVTRLECQENPSGGKECNLGEILSEEGCLGEMRQVKTELRARGSGDNTVSFAVIYNYHGNSLLSFGIWEKNSKNQYGNKRIGSTYGPVKVEINPGFLMSRIVDDRKQTTTEWVEEGQRFTVNINVRESGNFGQSSSKTSISNFKVKLNYLEPIADGKCDFILSGEYLVPKESIEVPTKKPLKCDLKANDNIGQEWITGGIEVDYDYEYSFVKQQSFKINTE